MHKVISTDGTAIAYDRVGTGPSVILIGGAFSYRAFPKTVELAELLSEHFTVINYDRRGRGDSGDTPTYAVEREIEDLQALIEVAGGSASLWGWSSGGVLALRAAARGLNVEKIAVYEPPFVVDSKFPVPPHDFDVRLRRLVRTDRRGAAVRYFMTKGMGMPSIVVAAMRLTPMWSKLRAVAHTLPYDWAVIGGHHGRQAAPARGVGVRDSPDARSFRREEPGAAAQRRAGPRRCPGRRRTSRAEGPEP